MAQHKHFPQGWSTNRLHTFSMCGFFFLVGIFFFFCLWAAEPVFIKTKKRTLPVWIRVLYPNCRIPYLMVYLLIELIWIFSEGGLTRKAESQRTENIFAKQKQGKLSQITQCQSKQIRHENLYSPTPIPSILICDTSLPYEVSTSLRQDCENNLAMSNVRKWQKTSCMSSGCGSWARLCHCILSKSLQEGRAAALADSFGNPCAGSWRV